MIRVLWELFGRLRQKNCGAAKMAAPRLRMGERCGRWELRLWQRPVLHAPMLEVPLRRVGIAAFLVLTIVYLTSRRNQATAAFEQKVDDAEFSLNNEEYLKAAELYHQAQQLSYDTDTNLRATYGQGMSYFLYGLIMSDDAYYKKAAAIYTGIIRQPNLEYSEHYVDALADLSFIYYYTPYAWDNPEWTALVGKLETMLSDMSSESFEQLSSN